MPPTRRRDKMTDQPANSLKTNLDAVVLALPPTAGKELLIGASGGQTQGDVAEMPATW